VHAGPEFQRTSFQAPSQLEAWIVSTSVWMRRPERKLNGSGRRPATASRKPATSIAFKSLKLS